MVPPCSDRISRVPPYSNGSFYTSTGLSPTLAALPNAFEFHMLHGLVRVRSPLLTESRLMSFPTGTEMFQFPAFALEDLCVQSTSTCPIHSVHHPEGSKTDELSGGFPHSEIPGSKGALASPGLIAECHVLHRLLPPRHPPNALIALDPSRKTTGEPLGRGTRAFQDQLGSFHFPATIRQARARRG